MGLDLVTFVETCGNLPLYTGPTCARGAESPLIQILAYILEKKIVRSEQTHARS